MKINRTLENPLFFGAKPEMFERAKELRKNMTEAEKLLWQRLRNKKLNGFKFRRQHPLIQFVADFYCHEARLVVEIDGGYHQNEDQKEIDENRTYELEQVGIHVIRFTNEEVIHYIEEVIERIRKELPAAPPNPPNGGNGRRALKIDNGAKNSTEAGSKPLSPPWGEMSAGQRGGKCWKQKIFSHPVSQIASKHEMYRSKNYIVNNV